jgi:hypothetical protein
MEEGIFPGIIVASVIPLLVILIAANHQKSILRSRVIQQRRAASVSHEMIKNLIGKRCTFSTGPFGETFKNVEVVAVDENWVRIQDGKAERLVNSEFVTSVKIVGDAPAR